MEPITHRMRNGSGTLAGNPSQVVGLSAQDDALRACQNSGGGEKFQQLPTHKLVEQELRSNR